MKNITKTDLLTSRIKFSSYRTVFLIFLLPLLTLICFISSLALIYQKITVENTAELIEVNQQFLNSLCLDPHTLSLIDYNQIFSSDYRSQYSFAETKQQIIVIFTNLDCNSIQSHNLLQLFLRKQSIKLSNNQSRLKFKFRSGAQSIQFDFSKNNYDNKWQIDAIIIF